MSKLAPLLLALLVLIPLILTPLLTGCSSTSNALAFVTVSERCGYGPGGVVAFAAWGLQLRYVRRINEAGGALTTLTNSDGDADFTDEGGFHPVYSPNGATIAMTSRRGTSEDIFTMAAAGDGGGVTNLTLDPSSDQQPSWGPLGDKVLFTTNRNGDNDIYEVATAAPGVATAMVATAANEQWASYNPAGTHIAFQREITDGNTDIIVLDIGAATETNLTVASLGRDEHPAWNHDGTKIAFTSNRAGDFDIWTMNPDGTGLLQLTTDSLSDGYPQWKPEDSSKIVFTRNREVWTMNPDGSNQDQLTTIS